MLCANVESTRLCAEHIMDISSASLLSMLLSISAMVISVESVAEE